MTMMGQKKDGVRTAVYKQKAPTVMRQANELALCHAGHTWTWLTATRVS